MLKEKSYSQETLDGALAELEKLPERPKNKGFNGYEAVKQLYPKISQLRQNGYTYEDIAKTLKEANVDLSPLTLKRYFKLITDEMNTSINKKIKKKIKEEAKEEINKAEKINDIDNNEKDSEEEIENPTKTARRKRRVS